MKKSKRKAGRKSQSAKKPKSATSKRPQQKKIRTFAEVAHVLKGGALQPTRPPSKIKVGKRFRIDKGDIDSLARSIDARNGVIQPIAIDTHDELIDGERRLLAWNKSKFAGKPIPVHVVDIDSIIAGEFDANVEREDFKPSELVAIKRALEPKLRAAAKARELTGKKAAQGTAKGRVVDQVGAFAGRSGRTIEKAEAVVDAAERDPERFGKLKDQMDRTGRVDGPFKRLKNIEDGDRLRAEPPSPPMQGPYRTLVADFPWPADLDGYRDPETRGYYPYATWSIDRICEYAAREVAPIMHEDGCAFWLWIPNFHLVRGCQLPVLKALGLDGSSLLTWTKPEIGQGQRMRGATEQAILAVRGDVPVLGTEQRTWFSAPAASARHSAKPAPFFQIVEAITPAPRYAYLFAPGTVPANWDGHGDRVGKIAPVIARAAGQGLLEEASGNEGTAAPAAEHEMFGNISEGLLRVLSAIEAGEPISFNENDCVVGGLYTGKKTRKLTKAGKATLAKVRKEIERREEAALTVEEKTARDGERLAAAAERAGHTIIRRPEPDDTTKVIAECSCGHWSSVALDTDEGLASQEIGIADHQRSAVASGLRGEASVKTAERGSRRANRPPQSDVPPAESPPAAEAASETAPEEAA